VIGVITLAALLGAGGPLAHGAERRSAVAAPSGAIGYDVGNASCSGALPTGGSFGIVGVTAGRPYHRSRCLSAEAAWAAGMTYSPQYYVNLANPGHKSSHWGKGGPRACHRKPKYDPGCAYDYGYEAAAAAWSYVRAIGSNGHGRWWLDVETDNTWGISRAGIAANQDVIRGAVHYLHARRHVPTGIYTETVWWDLITGGSTRFADVPVWGGGAGSKRNARHNCRPHSITGGPALLAQWIRGGVDRDIVC
jgi:hypothetical protein